MNDTRQRLIDATNELFRRHGYNGTSLKAVTAAAGAPTGSLYHFFPAGKVELAGAVITETGAAYGELFEMIFDAAPDPATGVWDFFDGAAEVLEQTDFIDICPIGTIAREMANTDDDVRRATLSVFELWTTLASDRFERAGIAATPARELATTVIAMLEGSFILARAARDATDVRTAGRHARLLVAHLCTAASLDPATT